jgi:TolB-like protein/DNA-binding winged helix-turn-helix (wHTH) protein
MKPAPGPAAMQIGEWIADPGDDSLSRGDDRVKIEPRMMRLLMRLAESPGMVLSQEELLNSVWSGVVVGPASVYQSVSQLRKILGDADTAPSYIETVARKGYRLIAPVAHLATPQPDSSETVSEIPAATGAPAQSTAAGWRSRRWKLAAAGAALMIAGAWFWMARGTVNSIVVLPFVDMTEGRTEQAFCDGMTEELSNWLAQVPALRVVARTSAFKFRDKAEDVRAIGSALGATHALEGSLRRSRDVLRVTVQLIATKDGKHLWSRNFDTPVGDVLRIQEQIARIVAEILEAQLTPEFDRRLAARRTASALANQRYYLALHYTQQLTKADNDRAIALYREAIAADDEFALAKIGLAGALIGQRYFNQRRIEDIAAEAMPLLESVAARSTLLPEFFLVRGVLYTELRQREAAMRDLQHALVLNPNSVLASAALGSFYLTLAQPRDAMAYYDAAIERDPLDFNLYASRCLLLTDMARFELAVAACTRARSLAPDAHWPYRAFSMLEDARGNIDEALLWNESSLREDRRVMTVRAERVRLLGRLGLRARVEAECRDAYAADPVAARDTFALATECLRSAVVHGGTRELRAFAQLHGLTTSDRPAVLFELANAELAGGDAVAARAYVDRALASPLLLPEDLASPWQARTGRSYLLITAAALRGTGDEAGATRRLSELSLLLARMSANGVRRHGVHELKAQLAAMDGDAGGAIAELRQAIELGWRDVGSAEIEPYFGALRGRADYRALLDQVRARNAADAAQLSVGAASASN